MFSFNASERQLNFTFSNFSPLVFSPPSLIAAICKFTLPLIKAIVAGFCCIIKVRANFLSITFEILNWKGNSNLSLFIFALLHHLVAYVSVTVRWPLLISDPSQIPQKGNAGYLFMLSDCIQCLPTVYVTRQKQICLK